MLHAMQITLALLASTLKLTLLTLTVDETLLRLQIPRLGLNHLCLLDRQSL
jgi:hypothetical protein